MPSRTTAPGLTMVSTRAAFARGARLDERMPGSGLGLAIARDLAEIYGGRVDLGRSAWGGLAATLQLPGVIRSVSFPTRSVTDCRTFG